MIYQYQYLTHGNFFAKTQTTPIELAELSFLSTKLHFSP